jgi:hypothetical protein
VEAEGEVEALTAPCASPASRSPGGVVLFMEGRDLI